jgi:hypothetical protein
MTDTPRHKYVAPAHFCAACRARGKTWNGGDPECAFQHGKPFSSDNWNCATMDLVRDLAGRYGDPPRDGVIRDYTSEGYDTYAVIRVDTDYIDVESCHSMYVTWYKSRGRTSALWLLGDEDDGPPRAPTEAEVLAIVKHYLLYDLPRPMTPERQAMIAQMDALRGSFMAASVEVEPGVHMLKFGGKDDDIPF